MQGPDSRVVVIKKAELLGDLLAIDRLNPVIFHLVISPDPVRRTDADIGPVDFLTDHDRVLRQPRRLEVEVKGLFAGKPDVRIGPHVDIVPRE